MRIKFAFGVIRELTRIKKKDKKLSERIQKQLILFQENPKHPSLRTRKLTGKIADRWSLSINKGLRMIYLKLEEDTDKCL